MDIRLISLLQHFIVVFLSLCPYYSNHSVVVLGCMFCFVLPLAASFFFLREIHFATFGFFKFVRILILIPKLIILILPRKLLGLELNASAFILLRLR